MDKPRLLIVEDNLDLINFLVACVSDFFEVIIERNGLAGIASAIEHVPDIIVSDIMMPEADGFQLCRTLKEQSIHLSPRPGKLFWITWTMIPSDRSN